MKNILCTLLVATAALATARAGNIIGTVHAEGKAGTDDESAGGAYASRKYKFAERVNYAELHDFVVYIQGTVGTNHVVAPTNPVVVNTTRVTQQGAMFNPHVLPVVAGTTVEWPNNDQIFHNVFSVSDAKQFDLGLYKGNPPRNMSRSINPAAWMCSAPFTPICIALCWSWRTLISPSQTAGTAIPSQISRPGPTN